MLGVSYVRTCTAAAGSSPAMARHGGRLTPREGIALVASDAGLSLRLRLGRRLISLEGASGSWLRLGLRGLAEAHEGATNEGEDREGARSEAGDNPRGSR